MTVSTREDTPLRQVGEPKIPKIQFFPGEGVPTGALQHVHQGNAAATVRAHGLAKMARRTVPYGFSCSSCAHMGRFAPRFSHGLSPQQPCSRPPPKIPPRLFRGGGCCITGIFADFGIFLDPIGGALSFCSKASTFGGKIFFAQTVMSSCSSAPEVYQKIFFEFFGRVWMARSALARTAPCGQVWDTKSSKYPLLGAGWPCFDPFQNLAETPSS